MSETEELEKLRLQNARYKAALEKIEKVNNDSESFCGTIAFAVSEALKEVDNKEF